MKLVLLILIWAVSWPAIKIGSRLSTAVDAFLRYLIAALASLPSVDFGGRLSGRRNPIGRGVRFRLLQMAIFGAHERRLEDATLRSGFRSRIRRPFGSFRLPPGGLVKRISRSAFLGVSLGIIGICEIAWPSINPAKTTIFMHMLF